MSIILSNKQVSLICASFIYGLDSISKPLSSSEYVIFRAKAFESYLESKEDKETIK